MEPCRTHCISFSSYRTRQQRDGVRGGRGGAGRWPLLNPRSEAAILSHTPTERRASLEAAEACCAVAGTDGLPSREPEGLIARPVGPRGRVRRGERFVPSNEQTSTHRRAVGQTHNKDAVCVSAVRPVNVIRV